MPGNLYKVRKPPCNRTLGIEIECFVKENKDSNYQGFFYWDDDGSLSRHDNNVTIPYEYYSAEFVSQPLTLPWMHRELTKLNKKFNWEVNSTCGIHIHVSRKWLCEKKAEAIMSWLIAQDEEDLLKLFGRKPNSYCRLSGPSDSRYRAINVTNANTIEFRGFASGSDEWPHWCVDFVTYLINNAYRLNIEAVCAFQQWWWQNEYKKYPPIPRHQGEVTLTETFNEAAQIPAVRRVRRVAPQTLGELLRERISQ